MRALKSVLIHSVFVRLMMGGGAWLRSLCKPAAPTQAESEKPPPLLYDGDEGAMRARLAEARDDGRLMAPAIMDYWGERYETFEVRFWTCARFDRYLEQPYHYERITAERAVHYQKQVREGSEAAARAELFRN